jgi:hypothetical protein
MPVKIKFMRKRNYESPRDRVLEARAASRIASVLGCSNYKIPERYGVDFMFQKSGSVFAWAEVKCRNHNHDKYETYFISADKFCSGFKLVEHFGGRFVIIVGWEDYVGAMSVDSAIGFKIEMGGRYDRADENDHEPMVHIPVSLFTLYDPI